VAPKVHKATVAIQGTQYYQPETLQRMRNNLVLNVPTLLETTIPVFEIEFDTRTGVTHNIVEAF
jgi:hypothetical protein